MSYCRWNSNSHQSDVYVYEDVSGGYTIMVARARYASSLPRPTMPPLTVESVAEYLAADQLLSAWLEGASLIPIGLLEDGEGFNLPTPSETADKLEELRAAGYLVPQGAVDALRSEA